MAKLKLTYLLTYLVSIYFRGLQLGIPVDAGRKNVLCTFILRPVYTGIHSKRTI